MLRGGSTPKTTRLEALPCIHPNAAALNIGSTEIIAVIPPDRNSPSVRARVLSKSKSIGRYRCM